MDATSARLADGTLAGSILSLDQALRNLVAFTGCTLAEALPTVTARRRAPSAWTPSAAASPPATRPTWSC